MSWAASAQWISKDMNPETDLQRPDRTPSWRAGRTITAKCGNRVVSSSRHVRSVHTKAYLIYLSGTYVRIHTLSDEDSVSVCYLIVKESLSTSRRCYVPHHTYSARSTHREKQDERVCCRADVSQISSADTQYSTCHLDINTMDRKTLPVYKLKLKPNPSVQFHQLHLIIFNPSIIPE